MAHLLDHSDVNNPDMDIDAVGYAPGDVTNEKDSGWRKDVLVRVLIQPGTDELVSKRDVCQAIFKALGIEWPGYVDEQDEHLEKGVAPHHAHFQERDKGGKFKLKPEVVRNKPTRNKMGRFSKRLTESERLYAQSEASRLQDVFGVVLGWVESDLESERISESAAVKRGELLIGHFYNQLFEKGLQAAGDTGIFKTPQWKAMLLRIIRDEVDYWRNFMHDVSAGNGKIQYEKRLKMYSNAGREAFWLGWVLGDTNPNRNIYWVIGNTIDHCNTCSQMEKKSPFNPQEFLKEVAKGFLPQSGELDCKGIHCLCFLTESDSTRTSDPKS